MRAKRRDDNHEDTREFLRGKGWSIADTAGLGYGIPDFFAGKPEFCAAVELKDGDKSPSKRKLTPAEQRFKDNWTGPYILALGPEDALAQLDILYARRMRE